MIEFVLSVFEKSVCDVIALIGYNIAVNMSIATKLGCGFVGYAIHRYYLPFRDRLSEHDGILTSIHAFMVKLHNLLTASKLLKFTSLKLVPKM